MTKLTLITLLILSTTLIASPNNGNFKLMKADFSRSSIASIISGKNLTGSLNYNDCSNVFQECIDSGESAYICEIIEAECYNGYSY